MPASYYRFSLCELIIYICMLALVAQLVATHAVNPGVVSLNPSSVNIFSDI